MEINITWNICRVCLEEESKNANGSSSTGQMRNIFNENKKLAHHIYECSGIMMTPSDSLPDKICQKCIAMVNNAVNFRKTCRSSNAYLQSILQRTKSATTLFKPERPPVKFSDEDIEEDKTVFSKLEENYDVKYSKVGKRKGQPIAGHDIRKKKLDILDSSDLDKNKTVEDLSEVKEEDSKDITYNVVVDNAVELEEFIEHSEEVEDQIFTIEENKDNDKMSDKQEHEEITISKDLNPKTSRLKKFYMNVGYTKLPNTEDDTADVIETEAETETETEIEETEISTLKQDGEELYFVLKDIKSGTKNVSNNENHLELEEEEADGEQTKETGNDLEYYAIEEEDIDDALMLRSEEEEVEDNQAQVSSTVETKDEIELHEQNSNLSNTTNDLTEEYIMNEFINEEDSSAQDSTVLRTDSVKHKDIEKTSKMSDIKSSLVILPRRRVKQMYKAVSATSSTSRNSGERGSQKQVRVCEICGNHFTNRHLMNIHMKVHRQEKNHECELCSKRFITACNLQAHMRVHTGERPFECQYCGRRFSDRTSHLRHERIHTNEKPFQCNNCGKSFTLATTLQNHMKVHTGERSYRCEPCGKSFKLPHHLKTHQNTTLHRAMQKLVTENQ